MGNFVMEVLLFFLVFLIVGGGGLGSESFFLVDCRFQCFYLLYLPTYLLVPNLASPL